MSLVILATEALSELQCTGAIITIIVVVIIIHLHHHHYYYYSYGYLLLCSSTHI
jgi:hypothetical protein